MDLFTVALSLGLALNPISEGYVEYSKADNSQDYICYANLKDYQHILVDGGIKTSFFHDIFYADANFTGSTEHQHITFDTGVRYQFKNFLPYLEFSGNFLNEEKESYSFTNSKVYGFSEKELNLKLGVKFEHELIKNIDFFGDFSFGYDFYNSLGINIDRYNKSENYWYDDSINCDYLSDMFRVEIKAGARFFKLFSVYGGIQSWQTIGYSEDTGSVFGGSTPCMVRNELGCQFKTNFKRWNPYVNVTYLCQHPEKPFDYYNKSNNSGDYLTEQFNYVHMEVRAGCEVKF